MAGKVTHTMRMAWDQRRVDAGRDARPGRIAARNQTGRSTERDEATVEQAMTLARAAGAGVPLDAAVAARMEAALGARFDHVRVHTGAEAAQAAQLLNARAFTIGSHIYFADREFAPGTEIGDRLLRHELTHVVQHGRGELDGEPEVAEESSAIEVEARAAEELPAAKKVAPEPAPAPTAEPEATTGPIARKPNEPAIGNPAEWQLHLLDQLIKLDLSKGVVLPTGEKRLELPRRQIGPIRLQECVVTLDGNLVKSGRLRAMLDDGRWRGSAVDLQVDDKGHVTGQLELVLEVAKSFVKRVAITLDAEGLHTSMPVNANDFASKDFSVLASSLLVELLPTFNALDVKLEGSARVKLAEGFADAAGTFTGSLEGSGKIDASIVANLEVPGIKAVANANLKWDGKSITFEAGAAVPFDLPGVHGTAKITYRDGKLLVESKDLAFTWEKLKALQWGPLSIEHGKLHGKIKTGQKHAFDAKGAHFTLDPGASLGLDGNQVSGAAHGQLALGEKGGTFMSGEFDLTAGPQGFDAAVVLDRATMPHVKVEDVHATIRDVGGANDWSVTAGHIEVDIPNLLSGKWTGIGWNNGLTGNIDLDWKLPQLKLPHLRISVLEGWKLRFPHLSLPDIDLGKYLGGFGKLLDGLKGIGAGVKFRDVDLSSLENLIESIDLSGFNLRLPRLPHLSIPHLDLHLPHLNLPKLGGGGGGLGQLLDKLSGLLKLRLDFTDIIQAIEVKEHDVHFADGKPVGSATIELDLGKAFKFLTGKVSVTVDSAAKDVLVVHGEHIRLAHPELSQWAELDLQYVGGKFVGKLVFKKTSGKLLGFDVRLVENQLVFADGKFTGETKLAAEGGAGSGEVSISYQNGELAVKGHGSVDAAQLTNGYLTGKLEASNADGAHLAGKIEIAKGPLVGMVKGIDATYDKGKLAASFKLTKPLVDKLSQAIPGITLTPADTDIHIAVHEGQVEITGEVAGHYAIPNLMSGAFKAGLAKSVPYGEFTVEKVDDKLAFPGASLDYSKFKMFLDEYFLPKDGTYEIGVKGVLAGTLKVQLAGHQLAKVDFVVGDAHGFELPGAKFTLDPGAHIGVDHGQLVGGASGKVTLGHASGNFATGKFTLTGGAKGLDADVTIDNATVPGIKAHGVHAKITDIAGDAKWKIDAGQVEVDIPNILSGKWVNLGWDGSLLGDLELDFKLPQLKLPHLKLSMLKGWRLKAPDIDLSLPDIDFSKYLAGFGKLLEGLKGLAAKIKFREIDLTSLDNLIDAIDFSGLDLHLPKFPHIAIPSLDLHLPNIQLPKLGGGGGLGQLLDKLSGLLKLRIDFSKLSRAVEVKDYDVHIQDGKPVGSATIDIDIGKAFKFLTGHVSVTIDSAAKDVLVVHGEHIRLADPKLAEWAELSLDYVGGKFGGKLVFKKTAGKLMGFDVQLLENKLTFEDGKFGGEARLGAANGSASGEVTIAYENGELTAKGHGSVDAASITNGYLTGKLTASNEHGAQLAGKIEIAKGPLVGLVKDIDATYDNGRLAASFTLGKPLMDKLSTALPGITITPNETPIQIAVHDKVVDFTGEVAGSFAIPKLASGTFKVGMQKSVPYGEFDVTELDPKLKIPGAKLTLDKFKVLLDEHFLPKDATYNVGVDVKGMLQGNLHIELKGGRLGKVDFVVLDGHGFTLPGAQFGLDPGAHLGFEDGHFIGGAKGHVTLGRAGGNFATGSFQLTGGANGLDADVTLDKGTIPNLSVKQVHAKITDITGTPVWKIDAGEIEIDLPNILHGKWGNLGWNGSLTGDIALDWKLPQLQLPSLNLSVLEGWKLRLPKLDFRLPHIDFSKYFGGLGKILEGLEGVQIGIQWRDVDVWNLINIIDTIDLSGLNLSLPRFPNFSIPNLSLHLPHIELPKLGGGGGGLGALMDKLSGLIKLRLDFSKLLKAVKVEDYDVNIVNGQPVGKATVGIDIGQAFKFLTGKLSVSIDTAAKDMISVHGEGIGLANKDFADWVKVGFDYVDGKLSGRVDFKKVAGKLRGIDVQAIDSHIAMKDGDWSGSARLGIAKAGVGSGELVIQYKDGELSLSGNTTLDAASVTGGYLTGVLKASNESGTHLAGKIEIAKGPLVGQVKDIDAAYDDGNLSASFKLGAPLMTKLAQSIPGITITPDDTPIAIKAHDGTVDITGEIGGGYVIPGLMSGTFKAGLKDNKPYAQIRVTDLEKQIKIPGAELGFNDFLLLLDEHLVPMSGKTDITVKLKGLITGTLHLDVKGGKLGGFGFTGTIAETPLTQPIKNLAIKYDGHGWSGEAKVHFKPLGEILDDGAALTLQGSATGFTIGAKDVVFKKGLLKGFKIDEAHLTDNGFGGTISSGGGDLKIGGVKAHIGGGSVTFSDQGFVKGDVHGTVDFTDKLKVGFGVKAVGEELSFDVATEKPIELHDLSKALEGKVTAKYEKGKFSFKAEPVKFAEKKLADLAWINRFEYADGNFDLDVHVKEGAFEYAAGKAPAIVKPTTLKWLKGLIDGEIVAQVGTTKVKAGWKHGDFFLGAGGEFNLVTQFPGIFSSGRVAAEGDTHGNASFKILEEIKFAKLPMVRITSLAGDIQGPNFVLGVALDDSMLNLPGLTTKIGGDAKLRYNDHHLSVEGHIKGSAALHVKGKEVVNGRFELLYANDEFGGSLDVDHIAISDKYLKPLKLALGYDPHAKAPTASGNIHFNAPGVADGNISVKPGDVDIKKGKLDFAADVHFLPPALKDFNLHVEHKNGDFKAAVKTDGAKEINVGGAQLVIGAGSNLAFDSASGQVSGRMIGSARVGNVATGVFDLGFQGGTLDGTIKAKVSKMPFFQEGFELDVGIKNGMLSTAKEIEIALDEKYKKYLDAKVHFKVTNNVITIGGAIDGIKNLGNFGKKAKGKIEYHVDSGKISATGNVPLDDVKFLKNGSSLDLYLDTDLRFGAKGHLVFQSFGNAKVDGGIDFDWLPGKFKMSGDVHADLYGLAQITLHASSDKKAKAGALETSDEGGMHFNLAGHVDATGLEKKFNGLKFSEPPAVSFWVEGDDKGTIDYGMDQLSTRIIHLPGAGACDVGLSASYVKDKGFNAAVEIHQLKFGFLKASGGLSIKESKFEQAKLNLESELNAVNLAGGITVHAGEITKLNAEAELKVVPGSGSALKWLKEGDAKASFKDGKLASASGKIILDVPKLLPIENTEMKLGMEGENIAGTLETDFKVPMAAEGKKGHLKATMGGAKGWAVHMTADIAPPGFQDVHVDGEADGSGDFAIGAVVVPKNNKHIKQGSIRVGYAHDKGGFFMGGSLTLAINDDLDGTVDVEYDAGIEDFKFMGEIKPHQKPPDHSHKEIGGYKQSIHIPLLSVGLADVGITMKFELAAYLVKPYLQFDYLRLSGSLKQLESGKLPEIDVGIKFGMGAGVSLSVGIGISGALHLLVATAEAGFRGDFIGAIEMLVGAAVTGKFGGDRDGLEIDVDPTVTADVNLKAALVAFANASVFGFTIIDEEYTLASFDLATFQLGSFKPIDPFTYVVGGSNPGFKNGMPSFKSEMPSGLQDGTSKGGEDPEGPERERKKEEGKRKVRTVLKEVKRAGAILDAMPKNWENGLDLDDTTECDNLIDLGDALDFYRDQADNAEEMVPDVKAITPGERLAKRFADNWYDAALRNYEIMSWRRAQLASKGIDPSTGVNVVAEREWVKTVQDQNYQVELESAQAEQARRLEEWTQAVMRQALEYAQAKATHDEHVAKARAEFEAAVAAYEKEGKGAQKQYELAAIGAGKAGAPAGAPPPAIETPKPPALIAHEAAIAPPLPPPMPLPVVMPIAPIDPPPVHVPPLPDPGEVGMTSSGVHKSKGTPPIPEPPVKPPPAPSKLPSSVDAAAAGTSKAVKTGGGGSAKAGGAAAPTPAPAPAPKKGKSGPSTITDVGADLGDQEEALEGRMAQLGMESTITNAKARARMASAPKPAAATPGAPGAADPAAKGKGPDKGGDKKDGKPAGAPENAAPSDPGVKAAQAAWTQSEAQDKAEAARVEAQYKQSIDAEKGNANTQIAAIHAREKAEAAKAKQQQAEEQKKQAEQKKDAPAPDAAAPTPAPTDDKKPDDAKQAPIGTKVVESFDMDGESHTLTVTMTPDGISVVMASNDPGQLRTKASTALSSAQTALTKLKQDIGGKKATEEQSKQKIRLQGIVTDLTAFQKTYGDAEKDKGKNPDQLKDYAVEIAKELVKIGRRWQLVDLGSMQKLEIEGHEHDKFIYETILELAGEVRAAGDPSPVSADSPLQKKLEAEIARGRGLYTKARSGVANTFEFHDRKVFVDHLDGYIFPVEDVGDNHEVMDGNVYAWLKQAKPLSKETFNNAQPFRQKLYHDYAYDHQWPVATLLAIAQKVAKGETLEPGPDASIFIAAMVAEPNRNIVSEVTNRLVLGEGDNKAPVFDQMPMTTGGTAPRGGKSQPDPTLPTTPANPQPPGKVTDEEIEMAKRCYQQKEQVDLAADITKRGENVGTRDHIKKVLRSMFVELASKG